MFILISSWTYTVWPFWYRNLLKYSFDSDTLTNNSLCWACWCRYLLQYHVEIDISTNINCVTISISAFASAPFWFRHLHEHIYRVDHFWYRCLLQYHVDIDISVNNNTAVLTILIPASVPCLYRHLRKHTLCDHLDIGICFSTMFISTSPRI